MSLFDTAWPIIQNWRAMFPGRVRVNYSEGVREVPEVIARDAALEELQLENAKLRVRLHHNKQHARNVTRQLLELSQQHATLLTECAQAKAEADYWHARCTKYVAENGDLPSPPSQG